MTSLNNFRKHKFHLFGKELTIAGMAGPHYNDTMTKADFFNDLRNNEKMDVVIGLRNEGNDSPEANAQGLEYYWIPIEDFSGATPAQYDKFYDWVKKATKEGKEIAVHCGAGNGRTGTALASLKLRELLEKQIESDPSYLNKPIGNTASVKSSMDGDISCTPLVAEAVEKIRSEIVPGDGMNGLDSVETINDIEALMKYEINLRKSLQDTLNKSITANQGNSLASEITKLGSGNLNYSDVKRRLSDYRKSEDLDDTNEDDNQLSP